MIYIASNQLNISKILKLLNINAVAQFVLKDYKGIYIGYILGDLLVYF